MSTHVFSNPSSNGHYSPSPYPTDDHHHYEDDHDPLNNTTHQFFLSATNYNSQTSSSSSKPLAPNLQYLLNSNDQNGGSNRELQHPQYQHAHEGDSFGIESYNDHGNINNNDLHQVKWVSSKMRVMLKVKKSDHPMINLNTSTSTSRRQVTKLEENIKPSSIEETDNNSSNSTTSSNNNLPIRVCSDCNTTKTPLWRSGPRGPKSLCNACGIRQRKARRAAAANNNCVVLGDQAAVVTQKLKVIKTHHKHHKKPSKGHDDVTKYKKRRQIYHSNQITTTPPPTSSSSSPAPKKINCVEDFLASLSKNLTFYHVLPQDEKEAAILLMALSCGYAHETGL